MIGQCQILKCGCKYYEMKLQPYWQIQWQTIRERKTDVRTPAQTGEGRRTDRRRTKGIVEEERAMRQKKRNKIAKVQ